MSVLVGLIFTFGALVTLVGALRTDLRVGPTGGATVRRVFQYALLYALLILVATGASTVLARAAGGAPDPWDTADFQFAQGLAFLVVGAPAFAIIAYLAARYNRANPVEHRSSLYVFYLGLSQLTAVIFVGGALTQLADGLWGGMSVADSAAPIVVWLIVWFLYWKQARANLSPPRYGNLLVAGSFVSLFYAAGGLVETMSAALNVFWAPSGAVLTYSLLLQSSLTLLFGAMLWGRYWVAGAQNMSRTPLWFTFVLPIGVGGGLGLAVGSGSYFIWRLLVWFVGIPGSDVPVEYFGAAAVQVTVALVGLLMWWYFRATLALGTTDSPRAGAAYTYLLSGAGLAATFAGVAALFAALPEAAAAKVSVTGSAVNTLLLAAVLLAAGIPLWLVFWRRGSKVVQEGRPSQAVLGVRSTYLSLCLWLSAAILVGALVSVAVNLFQDAYGGTLGLGTLYQSATGLGIVGAATAVFIYHLAVSRQERPAGEAATSPQAGRIVLIGERRSTEALQTQIAATESDRHVTRVLLEEEALDEEALLARMRELRGSVTVVQTRSGWVPIHLGENED